MYYTEDTQLALNRIIHICRDVNYWWLLRTLHSNWASIFFVCFYIHVGQGIYYGSYKLIHTWLEGIIILFMLIATAFLEYVLPWGQISLWEATVITNLLSAIPYAGKTIVKWLWGGFSIDININTILHLHFLLPFIVIFFTSVNLLFRRQIEYNNLLETNRNIDKIPFDPYYILKDITGFIIPVIVSVSTGPQVPYTLGDKMIR